jgi:hypothetical protein
MKIIKLKTGYEGTIIERYHFGHKDIRPPFTKEGGFQLKPVHPFLCYVTVLPPTIEKVMYSGEVLFSEVLNPEDTKL